ncbi:MAG TPA: hypothetical protein VGN90_15325, partial [Pyrinomonadaceae bacterium]|nr:hypothetical protein [Pyrinomonadaceae bacterium]
NALEARRIFHEAIGLYVKLDRKLDHAISLSHLATVEFVDALRQKEGGWPKVVLSQFRRADNLLQHAQEITESLGAFSFLLDLIMNRAHFEMKRERYNVALRYFNKAASSLEMTYLSMTDRRSANLFLSTCTPFYSVAISCALASGNESEALFFSERSKARRFLRDAAENTYEGHVDSTHSLFAKERDLLATIQPLRSRLIQQRSLSLQERESLYNAESQLRDLWQTMRQTPEVSNELSKRVHQPVEVSLLRQLVFGEAPVDGKDDKAPVSDEAEEELPGGGVMQCERCFVYNRISSTFCSACCLLLPKSVSVNMNLWTGQASEDELKQAFADNQYNEGSRLFHEGKIAEAEAFFEKAMEYATHPDYSFFYGLCRLGAGDSAAALRSFDDVSEQQFSFKYPFWPLPVSPDDFSDCLTKLRSNPNAAVETLGCLMNAYVDYSEKRQAQHR